MPMSLPTCLAATRKGYFKLLLTLCGVLLTTQLLDPTASLHAQKADRLFGTASSAMVTIDGTQHYQTIDGFGISEAFGPAEQMRTLSSLSDQRQVLDLLFNTSTGAGFSILRNLLPSDTNHTIEPNSPGSPTATPQYKWDHNSWGQVWLAKQAQTYGIKQFYLDAWSAPGFMKTNGDEANGGAVCGVPKAKCSTGDWRQAYANYLVQYVRNYQSENIPITDIGFVNEPNFKTSYSSMVMTPTQTADFVKFLASTLHASKLSPQIVCCDEEGWDLAQSYTDGITSNPTANSYVSVISSHGYTGTPNSALAGTGQKHIWETEWGTLGDQWDPSWDSGSKASGLSWAQNVYTGLTVAHLNAFFYWWGLASNTTDDGTLMRYQNNTLEISKRLWALANYSRFVRPGAIRIGATSSNNGLKTTAFKNTDGSLSLVILNTSKSATPVTFSLQNTGITQDYVVTPYLTNNSNNTAAQAQLPIKQQTFSAAVPARSLVTYQVHARTSR